MATDRKPRKPSKHFKRFFLRGLAVVLPSALTLWLLVKAYQWIDAAIAQPINRGIQWCIIHLMNIWPGFAEFAGLEPSQGKLQSLREEAGLVPSNTSSDALLVSTWRETNVEAWWDDHWYIHVIGLIVAIFAVYIAGRLVGGFIGRLVYRYLERLITSIPVVKKIYSWVKQVVDFLFTQDQGPQFSRVVAAEYPRRGVWSVGFQTGRSMRTIAGKAGDSVTVFIPSSPTPFTGYTITVPQADIIELPISVEEAIGFAVSGGVLCPPSEREWQAPTLEATDGDATVDSEPSDENSP